MSGEFISGVFGEVYFDDTVNRLKALIDSSLEGEEEVMKLGCKNTYDVIEAFMNKASLLEEEKTVVHVETKYKMVAKKVRLVALPLPSNSKETLEQASLQPSLC